MAAPTFANDLINITLADSTTGWSRYGVSGNPAVGADFAIQGTLCIDKQVSNGDGGVRFDRGSGLTLLAGEHVFIWHFTATPGITQTMANKGASVVIGTNIGTSIVAGVEYHIAGNDTFGAAARVARCVAVDYSVRTQSNVFPFRTLTGSPGAAPRYFGGGIVTTASARTNLGIDAIRVGIGGYIYNGELISQGDASDNPCTFDGWFASQDDLEVRSGLIIRVGAQYEVQGRLRIGQLPGGGSPTRAVFRDSNKSIVFADAFHAASTFNEVVLDGATSYVEWTNVDLQSLGSIAPGIITVTANNPTLVVDGGTWTDLGVITLRSNSSLTGVTLRRCGQINQNGASITASLITRSSAAVAMVASDTSVISDIEFVSDGTGHAIELTTAGTYNFTDLTFTGYAASNGSTGNEALFVSAASGTVTVNVTGGTVPSVRTAGATVVVNASATLTLEGLETGSEVRAYVGTDPATSVEIAGVESSGTSFSFSQSVPGQAGYIVVFAIGFKDIIIDLVYSSTNQTIPVQQVIDRVYSNPA